MVKTSAERERVQQNLERLRDAVGREVGWMPRARRWILPIAAFAVGVALAIRRKQARTLPSPTAKTPVAGGGKRTTKAELGPRRVSRGRSGEA